MSRPGLGAATSMRQTFIARWSVTRAFARYHISAPKAQPAPTSASKVAHIESRLPRFLAGYLTPLRNAPISHITAFLILHELTAILPLFGLAAAFHHFNWLPPYISEGKWVSEGVDKFGKWMRKRGWLEEEESRHVMWWGRGEKGVRVVVELATAYAITKAFLPLRLVMSVWATPWFARWTVLPLNNRIWRVFSKKTAKPATMPLNAGETGAVGGGVTSKIKT